MNKRSPTIKTPERKIVVVSNESSKDYDNTIEKMEKILSMVIKGSEANAIVLGIVLRTMMGLKKGKGIGFDFGTAKEWYLKRTK